MKDIGAPCQALTPLSPLPLTGEGTTSSRRRDVRGEGRKNGGITCSLIFFVFLLSLPLFALPLFFTPQKLAEIRVLPKDGAEAVIMVKAGTLLEVKSSVTDTLAREWYLVVVKGSKEGGFVLAADLEPVEGGDKGEALLHLKKEAEADKKRRMAAIKSHPDWPRRIKSAVRNGSICLRMNRDQLEAAWTQPYQVTRGFILGAGDVEILFFQPESPVTVVMKNNEIIGWSEKKP